MKVEQVYQIMNKMVGETLGKTDILAEDLHNVVDVGKEIVASFQVSSDAFDNYVKKLINHIGKVVFVNRTYSTRAPSILMDGWEYGSILEKIDSELPAATVTNDWQLEDGTEYKQDVFKSPKGVTAKFWNKRTTFSVELSITEKQVKESFSSAQQLNAFFSMLQTKINNRLTLDIDNLKRRTINNLMGLTVLSEVPDGSTISGRTGVKARNLLYEYNQAHSGVSGFVALTASNCLSSLDFLKYSATEIALVSDYMEDYSVLYNVGGRERFTPKDKQHIVMLSEFAKKADVYLQSDTFHNEFTKLPEAERVNYWQGSGTDFKFNHISDIHIVVDDGKGGNGQEVVMSGVIATIFDHDACGVACPEEKTTSHYNANADFYNYWYKKFAAYFNDSNENCVVFYVA